MTTNKCIKFLKHYFRDHLGFRKTILKKYIGKDEFRTRMMAYDCGIIAGKEAYYRCANCHCEAFRTCTKPGEGICSTAFARGSYSKRGDKISLLLAAKKHAEWDAFIRNCRTRQFREV